MKLAKLSLAAIVAVSAMATFASAASLEEAIKGVDLTGAIRYRADLNNDSLEVNKGGENHRFVGFATLTVPVADGLKTIITGRYDSIDKADDEVGTGEAAKNLEISQAYFQYATKAFSVNVGKMALNTPWNYTDLLDRTGDFGNGAMMYYTGVPGWTFGAGAFANTNLVLPFGTIATGIVRDGVAQALLDAGVVANLAAGVTAANAAIADISADYANQNLYAAAAIGSMGPVNAQFWLAKMDEVFDYSAFAELSFKAAGFSAKAQVNQMKVADELDIFADNKGVFVAGELGYGIAGFSAKVGASKTDEEMPIFALDSNHKMIRSGKQMYAQTWNFFDTTTVFGEAAYKFGDVTLGAGYSQAKTDGEKFGTEWYVDATYQYSKNFKLFAYYSDMNIDDLDGVLADDKANDNKRVRLEATYSF